MKNEQRGWPTFRPMASTFLVLTLLLLGLLLLVAISGCRGATFVADPVEPKASWPGWRGPERTAKSPDVNLLPEWPPGGPSLVWEAAGLGSGFSSVAIAEGRVFTLGDVFIEAAAAADDDADDGAGAGGEEFVIALDAEDGVELWRTAVGAAWAEADLYPGSRSTPSVANGAVVVLASDGTLSRLDAATGELRWSRSLVDDFSGAMAPASAGVHWTYSESPLIDGDRVVVTPGVPEVALLALRLDDGAEIWRTSVPDLGEKGADGAGYSSVVVSFGGGVRQYVQLLGRGLIGVRADDGSFLWGYNRVANNVANIPTPLVQDNLVFASTGYGTGAALLELTPSDGGGVDAQEVYFLEAETFQNHHGGMLLHDGVVYAGTGHNRGFPIAIELSSGNVLWGPERNDGRGSAAVAFADDKLYMRYQNGLMLLVEATPEGYVERSSFAIPGVEQPSWSHPVIIGGRLYLREQDRMFVYDLRKNETQTEQQ